MKFIKLLPLVLLMFVFSCKTSTKKGKEKLDDATDNTIEFINSLAESDFSDAVAGTFDLFIPEDLDKKSFKLSGNNFELIQDYLVSFKGRMKSKFPTIFNKKFGDEKFSIADYAGTYTWNASEEDWVHSSTPSDQIVVLFPSNNSSTNDCKFVLSKYVEDKFGEYYIPTEIFAELYMDDKKIAYLDYTGDYYTTGVPKESDLKLNIAPLTLKVKYTFEDKIATTAASLDKGIRTIYDYKSETTFKDDNMYEAVSGNGVFHSYKLENAVNMGVLLKIKYDFDYSDGQDDYSCDYFNEHTNIKIYTSHDRLIGTVICDENNDCDLTIVFNDGTQECVETYLEKIDDAIWDIDIDKNVTQ